MTWKISRNKNYNSRNDSHTGKCSKFNELATISIKLIGKQICKTDLQPTFSSYLCNCSLLEKKDNDCIMSCSLFEEYKNSHNF